MPSLAGVSAALARPAKARARATQAKWANAEPLAYFLRFAFTILTSGISTDSTARGKGDSTEPRPKEAVFLSPKSVPVTVQRSAPSRPSGGRHRQEKHKGRHR